MSFLEDSIVFSKKLTKTNGSSRSIFRIIWDQGAFDLDFSKYPHLMIIWSIIFKFSIYVVIKKSNTQPTQDLSSLNDQVLHIKGNLLAMPW